MALHFKVTLNIKKQPENQNVFFKVDGGRFEQEKTIKFNVNATYTIEFQVKPPQLIEKVRDQIEARKTQKAEAASLNIHGGRVEANLKSRDESETVYTAYWSSTGLEVDKKGKRHELPIIIELKNQGILKLNLQGKFYGEKETSHSHWGNAVSYIEFDCKMPENSTYVDVLKETYR